MAITVKEMKLWRREVENKPGALGRTLEPLAGARADLQVVMGYAYPETPGKAAIEVYPVSGKKAVAAAESAGLLAATVPALIVQGDNRAGLGHAMASALAGAGINISFLVAQVIGRKYSAVFGFENEADARRAIVLIKKAAKKK